MIRLRLDHGELLPGGPVGRDGGIHPVRPLHRLEPEAVVSEPVLGVVHEQADEFFLVELPQLRGTVFGGTRLGHGI